jgi:hypothetical protein
MSSITSNTNVMTLSDLAALAGNDSINMGRKGQETQTEKKPFENPFETNIAFPVEVTAQEYVVSKGGYDQIKLKLGIVTNDGTVQGGANLWLTLPLFSEEMLATADAEKLNYLKERFGKNLADFLRATDPEIYSVFARAEKDGKKWKFYGYDGEVMTAKEKTARETMLGKAIIGAAKALKDGTLSVVGKRVWYVRVQSEKDANKTFDNFYSTQPEKYAPANV